MGSELDGEIKGTLKTIADDVRDVAKETASRLDLQDSGKLIRGIKSGVTQKKAVVRSTATRGGYRYPAIFEFSKSYLGGKMSKPFLGPAVEAKRDDTMKALEEMLEDLANRNRWRGDL